MKAILFLVLTVSALAARAEDLSGRYSREDVEAAVQSGVLVIDADAEAMVQQAGWHFSLGLPRSGSGHDQYGRKYHLDCGYIFCDVERRGGGTYDSDSYNYGSGRSGGWSIHNAPQYSQ